MAGATASSQQSAAPSSTDLPAVDLGAETFELPTDDRDTDTDESDDEATCALAVAALLPGLACAVPTTSTSGGGTACQTDAIEGAFIARRAEIDVSQSAVEELTGESADASDGAAAEPASAPVASNTQGSSSQVQMHAMLASHASRAADPVPGTTINAAPGTPAFNDELGTQLTWMAINGREAASLRLSPEHLGPLEVRISMREGEASVYFGASNPDTRSALEQSLPRLRELFASQGIVLADAGVSRDAPRNAFKPSAEPRGSRGNSDAASDAAVTSVTLARMGLIDTYV
jgi:flagellar hook-length control protein FliK